MKNNSSIITKLLFFCFVLLQTLNTQANNISVANISITGQNTTAGTNNAANYSMVKFNLAWENSWRSAALNWDAAWVFVKYRVNGGAWNHCNLHNTGHTAATGSTIDAGLVTPSSAFNITSNPAVGVFIYKNADGNGNVNYQNVQLRWNYGSQGVADNAVLDVQVFAIEMVYVPTGAFAVGDGGTLNQEYTLTTINTGNATTAPSGTGSLGGQAGGYPTGQTAPSSPNWPNGYNAFYTMKYELTQGQYRDFLNTLTYPQQANRCEQSILISGNMALTTGILPTNRNGIEVKIAGNLSGNSAVFGCDLNSNNIYDESIDGEWIAANYLSWGDLASYMDWSALRPMTELEFEKSCRGILLPILDEYAWGTNSMNRLSNVDSSGHNNERISTGYTINNGVGNISCCNTPLRVGIFSSNSSNTGRVSSGGTFYGIMEMSGNVAENTITMYNSDGLSFIGSHGDGILNSSGDKTNYDWASSSDASGTGPRGAWGDNLTALKTSSREYIYQSVYYRSQTMGGRGVRSAQ